MANNKSAKKRIQTAERNRLINKSYKSTVKTFTKKTLDNCDKFKKFTFWSEHLILHTEQSLMTLLKMVGFSNIEITYYQRYNIFNHLNWLSNGKPGGHKNNNFNDDNLIKSYNDFLVKNKKTDTLIAYCHI